MFFSYTQCFVLNIEHSSVRLGSWLINKIISIYACKTFCHVQLLNGPLLFKQSYNENICILKNVPSNFIAVFDRAGIYWLAYIIGKTGAKQIQDSPICNNKIDENCFIILHIYT